MRPVLIQSIPHKSQRYETCGDYYHSGGITKIQVSELGDPRYEFLIALHELIEQELVRVRGIDIADVDAFDRAFEDARADGDDSEPGDSPDAPYQREHQFATRIERLVAEELGVDWDTYDRKVVELGS